jgi:hypothetical protein
MNALARRLVIAASVTPGVGAAAVVALVVTAFAALAGTGDDPASHAAGGSVCTSSIAALGDAVPCAAESGASSDRNVTNGTSGNTSDGVSAGSWGDYSNGMIPASALCPLTAAGQLLRCDAANAWNAMSAAYRTATGSPICITDSYRTLAVQVALRAEKPALAAIPGTSNHGWALAVDLCEAGRTGMGFTTPTFRWLEANAAGFGWVLPAWADPGRGQEEPWHWEYIGGAS